MTGAGARGIPPGSGTDWLCCLSGKNGSLPEDTGGPVAMPTIVQQNAYVERYNRTVRYDWLAHHLFDSIDEVQNFATDWLWTYNHERPNMAIGGITPKQKLALAA